MQHAMEHDLSQFLLRACGPEFKALTFLFGPALKGFLDFCDDFQLPFTRRKKIIYRYLGTNK